MLKPRALNRPTIPDNSPGSSATTIESVCRILSLNDHVARVSSRRHDRKNVLFFRDDDVDDGDSFMVERRFENVMKLGRSSSTKAGSAVRLGKFHKIRCN